MSANRKKPFLFVWRSCINDKGSGLPHRARHVALSISLHMNGDGQGARVSLTTIANETGLNKSQVLAALNELEAAGWLSITRGRPGRGHTNEYVAEIPGDFEPFEEWKKGLTAGPFTGDGKGPEKVPNGSVKGPEKVPTSGLEDVEDVDIEDVEENLRGLRGEEHEGHDHPTPNAEDVFDGVFDGVIVGAEYEPQPTEGNGHERVLDGVLHQYINGRWQEVSEQDPSSRTGNPNPGHAPTRSLGAGPPDDARGSR